MKNEEILLQPYQLNSFFTLKNKIIMAPMTRAKSTQSLVPTDAMTHYYARRSEAGLIITEGTIIRPDGLGYENVPGIFSEAQIAGWQRVTQAVHQQGGLIFLQLWHVGRVSHPTLLVGGALPISASNTVMTGRLSRSDGLMLGESREATLSDIQSLIEDFARAADNAIRAGFDGVEIHGANGYLIDQFLHYHTNKRQDAYGGTKEHMARFALEIVKACGERIGYERLGIRLSPGGYLNEIIGCAEDQMVFAYLLSQLNDFPIAYVHTGNFDDRKTFPELNNMTMTQFMRAHYRGTLIACGQYTIESSARGIVNNEFDLVAFGRPFIANPNLINLIKNEQSMKAYDANMLLALY